jgi:hypothetical protein
MNPKGISPIRSRLSVRGRPVPLPGINQNASANDPLAEHAILPSWPNAVSPGVAG